MSWAIIGGTGLHQLPGLEVVEERHPETPWGRPSRPLQRGRLNGETVWFLQRHGSPAAVPPHRINYRANIAALQAVGATRIVGINAVGGLHPDLLPGTLVVPDQLVDYTWGREHTFDEGADGHLLHIDFTEPYDAGLREALLAAARSAELDCRAAGVHAITQGPRLETAAEVRRLRRDGGDVVGMTGMPEAALAREAGLAYASLCMVVNAAAGLGDAPLTLAAMRETLEANAGRVRVLLANLLAAAAPG